MPRIPTLIARSLIGFVAGAGLLFSAHGAKAQVSANQQERNRARRQGLRRLARWHR